MPSKTPTESDRVDAILRLLGGLAGGQDVFEVAAAVSDLHPRYNTFPGEVYMRLAADALDAADVDRNDPIAYERLVEDYLSECDLRGWEKRKIQYAILSSGAFRGGIEPDLLSDTAWRTDDFGATPSSLPWRLCELVPLGLASRCRSLRNGWLEITVSNFRSGRNAEGSEFSRGI